MINSDINVAPWRHVRLIVKIILKKLLISDIIIQNIGFLQEIWLTDHALKSLFAQNWSMFGELHYSDTV
jgi:alpha-N-acetylglucosamine transferase